MDEESEAENKEAITVYSDVLTQHSLSRTKLYHQNPQDTPVIGVDSNLTWMDGGNL